MNLENYLPILLFIGVGIAAAVFFASTLALSFIGSRPAASSGAGVMDQVTTPAKPAATVPGTPDASKPQNKSNEIPK